jgi:hypothetical protein
MPETPTRGGPVRFRDKTLKGAETEVTLWRRAVDLKSYGVCCGTNGVVTIPPEIRTVAIVIQVVVLTAPVLTPETSLPMQGERPFV